MVDINRESYFVVQGWMVTELKLTGNRLLIFAIIHGFSRDGKGVFNGSAQYLADWTNSTRRGVMDNLKWLTENGLIVKKDYIENGVKSCSYRVSEKISHPMKKVHRGYEETSQGGMKKVHRGYEETSHNNIEDNLDNNLDNNKSPLTPQRGRVRAGVFVRPSVEEVEAYCRERGNGISGQEFCDFYASKGWKVGREPMKDWQAAIRTWENKRKKESANTSTVRDYGDPEDFYK